MNKFKTKKGKYLNDVFLNTVYSMENKDLKKEIG